MYENVWFFYNKIRKTSQLEEKRSFHCFFFRSISCLTLSSELSIQTKPTKIYHFFHITVHLKYYKGRSIFIYLLIYRLDLYDFSFRCLYRSGCQWVMMPKFHKFILFPTTNVCCVMRRRLSKDKHANFVFIVCLSLVKRM